MVDVDPEFSRGATRFGRCAEAVLRRGVERDGDIEILRFAGGWVSSSAARQKTVFLEQAILVPDPVTSLPSCWSESARASWLPSASPSGRTWLRTAKSLMFARRRAPISAKVGCRAHSCFLRRRFDFLQDLENARAAFDRIIEMKNEMRRVFQNDAVWRARSARTTRCSSSFAIAARLASLSRGR